MSIATVLVPWEDDKPLQILEVDNELLDDAVEKALRSQEVRKSLLLRPSDAAPGLYAHQRTDRGVQSKPNLRATRLSMACGLFSIRFYGDVILSRSAGANLTICHVQAGCLRGPDLRSSVVASTDDSVPIPDWIGNATQQNYHDRPVIARLVRAMKEDKESDNDSGSSSLDDDNNDDGDSIDSDTPPSGVGQQESPNELPSRELVTRTTLCLYCRRPASTLCDCGGAYFCDKPRKCRSEGWSHDCLCSTWKVYTERRNELSTFPLGDWYKELVGREFQTSEEPYEVFLARLGITKNGTSTSSWWRTEMDGWSGGESDSAKTIDVTIRRSYAQGFSPLTDIPPERRVTEDDVAQANISERNVLGFLRLQSWDDYYRLRGISSGSPVALLLTFPVTLYYLLVEYGEVPCTVARMLKRPLRIHVVGAEKEINFLDLFQEVAFIVPPDFCIELVFCVRQDMLPPSMRSDSKTGQFEVHLTANLRIIVVSGTYGESLDPNFDCGSGAPDMLVAFNAGLYAYESWRSVVDFLDQSSGVVGVFTDYNEFSGVQCASLGGAASRETTRVCPFRQPRAMPVYSMNLPQFSNGFLYALNAQELD